MNNNFFKYLSLLLLGLILGYLIRGWSMSAPQVQIASATEGSIKIMGEENAPITIVEYSDFQCPLCKKYYNETFHTIVENYVKTGKVKYVFKQFPLNMHPQAPNAALAAECGLEQGKFWEIHEALFDHQHEWSGQSNHLDIFKQLAKDKGLNADRFNACLDSGKFKSVVEADYQEGLNRGIRGTPSFYINEKELVGAQETAKFTELLDQALAQK